MKKSAIILAGGDSRRMGIACEQLPKALLMLNKETIIKNQVKYLGDFGYDEIVIACQEKYKKHFEEELKDFKNPEIKLSLETKKLGTSGAIKQAMKQCGARKILVINSDDVANVNLKELEETSGNTIIISRPLSSFGRVAFNEKDDLIRFVEKGREPYYTSIGWYYLSKDFQLVDEGSIEYDVFPKSNGMKVFKHYGKWIPVNTMKDLDVAREYFE